MNNYAIIRRNGVLMAIPGYYVYAICHLTANTPQAAVAKYTREAK